MSIGADYNFTDMLSVLGNIGLKSNGDDSICINVYNVNGPDPTLYFRFHDIQVTGTPLSISNTGVKAGIFETERLKITRNPGSNYVLISDIEGNASWANPASFTDNDRFFNHDKNLYAGAPKVGVGTMTPLQPFHCNGDLLISGSTSKLIFSADSSDSNGDYTVGYRNSGLAFQKPWDGDNIETIPDYYYLFIHDNHNLGIGTSSPRAKLEITMDNSEELPYGIILNQKSDSVKVNEIRFDMDDEEHWAVGHRFWGDTLDAFFIWNETKAISSVFVEAESGNVGIENHFPMATLDVNGSFKASCVGIGTDPPDADSSWKLCVEGGIMARELKITINPFPDYVFSSTHYLMPLNDLDQFIRDHNHLPGIPSEAEVAANNGIEVGQMQAKLLEKIEEQTLYIIALQRQIDELKQAVTSLKSGKP